MSPVVAGPQARAMPEARPSKGPAPQVKGERMSWLVGGPRSGEARNRQVTPDPRALAASIIDKERDLSVSDSKICDTLMLLLSPRH